MSGIIIKPIAAYYSSRPLRCSGFGVDCSHLQLSSSFILQVMKLIKGGGWPTQDTKLVLGGAWTQTQVSFSLLKITIKTISPVDLHPSPIVLAGFMSTLHKLESF